MYQDTALLRTHTVKIRLSDAEAALINALVDFTGEQRAVLLRDLILEQARSLLFGEQPNAGMNATEVPVGGRRGVA